MSSVDDVMARRAAIRAAAHPPSVNVTLRVDASSFIATMRRVTRAMEQFAEAMKR